MSEIPKHLAEHCNRLGFTSIDGYFSWCKINKFSLSLNKSPNQLDKERAFITESKALSVLKRANVASDLKNIIMQYSFGNVFNPLDWMTALYETNDKKTVTDFLLYLNKKTKILEYKEYHGTLSMIFKYSDKWVRPIQEWEPKSKNTHRQISSLLRHLFAKYEVPIFMDSAWIVSNASLNTQWADWYIHIGMGNNIRTAQQLPYPMTKKEAHLFMQTPDALSIQDGFTYAQIMNNGGDWRLVRTLLGTRLKGFYQDNLFKNSLIKFFVDNPMLDHEQMGPIVDYIWNQKFETREVFLERGIREMEPPPQPNFSMTGRTAESLMNQVDRWHRQLGKEKKGGNLQWSHSSINDFHYTEGKGDTRKDWAIIELLSSNELASEGRSMHHCVSSYAHSCASRRTSIWSLRMTDKTGTYIYLTIELKQNQICQMRGKNNRMPEPKERMIVERWASKEKLTIDTYGWF